MKNVILYYYNLNNITLTPYYDKVLVKSGKDIFLFERVDNLDEVKLQYSLTKDKNEYYDFIINRENSIFTQYRNNYYVLLRTKNKR